MQRLIRISPWIIAVALGIAAFVYGFWPTPLQVETTEAVRGDLTIMVQDDGRTRIREKVTLSAPVPGKLLRIELDEGDPVQGGKTVLARILPNDPAPLDARLEAQAKARVQAANAGFSLAGANLDRVQETHRISKREYDRAVELLQKGALPQAEFDEAEHKERVAKAAVRSTEFAVAVAKFEVELAEAALARNEPSEDAPSSQDTWTITSPVDGKVLRVFEEHASVVAAGAPLIEIGDPTDLEMVIDVLSADAVAIHPGARVVVEQWGGEQPLEGVVRVVEPSAFLKVSALGVEEQRVNVVADFVSKVELRRALGDEYRIEARIVVDEVTDVIKIPTGALIHEGNHWVAFRVVNGRVQKRILEVGQSNGLETVVTKGIDEGDVLILYPSDKIHDGAHVDGKF